MNPEIKAKWVEALRSGEYEQGDGYLDVIQIDDATGDPVRTFCCLGVLCDIAIKEGVTGLVLDRTGNGTGFYRDNEFVAHSSFLPNVVQDWAGVSSEGTIPGDGVVIRTRGDEDIIEDSLIAVNDSGIPFSKIADIIEERF